jgi:hypothetical protein
VKNKDAEPAKRLVSTLETISSRLPPLLHRRALEQEQNGGTRKHDIFINTALHTYDRTDGFDTG